MAGLYGDGGARGPGGAGGAGGREMCAGCGAPADGGEMFCVSCGAYLGWDDTGARAVVREQPPVAGQSGAGGVPGPAGPSGAGGVPGPAGLSGAAGPSGLSGPSGAAALESVPSPWPDLPRPQQYRSVYPSDPLNSPSRPPRHTTEAAHPAEAEYPAGAAHPTEAAHPAESAYLPGAAESAYPTARDTPPHTAPYTSYAPPPPLIPCPDCHIHNDETRTYCTPCGAVLRPEPEPEQLTRRQRLRKQWEERPRPWHLDRRWCLLPAALPVFFAFGLSTGWSIEAVRGVIPAVEDRFSDQVATAPSKVEATSEAKGYEAGKAVDGVDNQAWAPGPHGQGAVGQSLTATFQQPFRLTGLVILNGASKKPKEYLAVGRPTAFTAIAVTASGKTERKELRLADQPGPQDFRWGVDDVVSVELRIDGVHAGPQPDAPVALAEVQFFTRQDT